jgi:hypothetical protein
VPDAELRRLVEQDLQIILASKPNLHPAILAMRERPRRRAGYPERGQRNRSPFRDAAANEDSLIFDTARLPEVVVEAR